MSDILMLFFGVSVLASLIKRTPKRPDFIETKDHYFVRDTPESWEKFADYLLTKHEKD